LLELALYRASLIARVAHPSTTPGGGHLVFEGAAPFGF
jgi:hypothetical protein